MIADMLTLILVLAPLFLMLYIGGLIAEQHDKKEESTAAGKQTEDSENKRNKPYLNCTRKGA